MTLDDAVDVFLQEVPNANTARTYGVSLRALVVELGTVLPVSALDDEAVIDHLSTWFSDRWGAAPAATANTRLDGLSAAVERWRDHGWIAGNPLRHIRRRRRTSARVPPPDRFKVVNLLRCADVPLRERTLWSLLYDSASHVEEVLTLDVPQLDLRGRRAEARRADGTTQPIAWGAGSARLLTDLLGDRVTGPVFLARQQTGTAASPLDPPRARLSYRRAAECLAQSTGGVLGGPWTLSRLRRAAMCHAADDRVKAHGLET